MTELLLYLYFKLFVMSHFPKPLSWEFFILEDHLDPTCLVYNFYQTFTIMSRSIFQDQFLFLQG